MTSAVRTNYTQSRQDAPRRQSCWPRRQRIPASTMYHVNAKQSKMSKASRVNANKQTTEKTAAQTGAAADACQGCRKPIRDRYLLNSLGRNWHEDCLKCSCCEARLAEVGECLYTRANLILCKRDYLRIFGNTGLCSACGRVIQAFEYIMRAKGNVYHLNCFSCHFCGYRFCVGDRFYLSENKILCETHYNYNEKFIYGNNSYENSRMNTNSPIMDGTNHCRPHHVAETDDCNNNGHNQLNVS